VAAGAFLIAVKETWDLHEAYERTGLAFGGLILVMGALCVANAVGRRRRRKGSALPADPA
jgi:hypothetical protein